MLTSKPELPRRSLPVGRRTFLKHASALFAALGSYFLKIRLGLAQVLKAVPEEQSEGVSQAAIETTDVLRYHTVLVDDSNKILPWFTPTENAYDHYLDTLWTWLPTVPNGPSSPLPMYYLYCGFEPGDPITPDTWENDWGERVPNFVEFGRLYYAYTGNTAPLDIARDLADYALAHGMTPANFAWPNFPFGAANAGAAEINGDNVAWNQNDILIDLGSDMGMSFYKLYLVYGNPEYRTAAINVADTLAAKIQPGTATNSPWPYVVNASTGAVRSRYTSNFAGALTLFDLLIEHGEPNTAAYATARQTLRNWILQYPMVNGNWVDGHSDNFIDGTTNWSNTTKSNMNLYLLDNPDFDPDFLTDVPKLLQWTEDYMVNVSTHDGLPGQYYGASVVAEQVAYMMRMGYETSRQAAEYAGWYAVTGDPNSKDKAYRGFNYSTYMMKASGESSDGPTDAVGYWWGDCYGEGPRMFFYGFKAVPEWAPPRENHILYSKSVLKNVVYGSTSVQYTATNDEGTEYLRLAFNPTAVTVNGVTLSLRSDLSAEGYTLRELGNGDYAVAVRRGRTGDVVISSGGGSTLFTIAATAGIGGSITPSGSILVNDNEDLTFSITPDSGYAVADVRVDEFSVGPVVTYTFSSVTQNHTIAASFKAISTGGIIGYSGPGTTTDYISDASGSYVNATRFLATANLTVTTMKAKVRGITGRYKCAIYSDDRGVPRNLLAESAEVTNPQTGWQTFPLSSSQGIQNGTYYWLAIWSSLRSTSAGIYCDRSGAVTRWTTALTYGAWPDPVGTVGGGSYRYCIYAEDPGSVSNLPPSVLAAAFATPNPVNGTATSLSVLGGDDGGEADLSYTWAATGTPPAPVNFLVNGTNTAKNTIATFTRAGDYSLQVTIRDTGDLTAISSVNVTVNQRFTSISVSPASASVATGATQQFTATAKDQFGANLIAQPTFTWSVSGGGTINTNGLFTAGGAPGGPYIVTATSAGTSGTASVTITAVNNPPTVAAAAAASPNPLNGTSTDLSVLGADDGGEANLSYNWASIGSPPAPVTFSANGTNAAKDTVATFTEVGSYSLQVTIRDAGNLTATSNVNVTVNQRLATISVAPAGASVATGATQQFTATATDQFGADLTIPPIFTWSVSGGGTISASGLFTAGGTAGGPYTVTATSAGVSGTATVSVAAGINILGNNLVGNATDWSGANDINCWRFPATSSFTASNMRIYLASRITGRMKCAIYADNNGTPGTLLAVTSEITNPSSGWVTFALSGGLAITSGNFYWLAAWANVEYGPRCQTTGGTARWVKRTFGVWPNPLNGTIGPYSNYESIYAY